MSCGNIPHGYIPSPHDFIDPATNGVIRQTNFVCWWIYSNGKIRLPEGLLYVHYSPEANFSFGIEMLEGKRGMSDRSYLRGTWLAHRINKRNSQQYLYLDGGIDASSGEYFIGAMGDCETRRYFSGFRMRNMKWDTVSFLNNYLQMGFAPYLGDYGDLHSWLMIKR